MDPAIIVAAISGIESLVRLIQTTRETLRQNGELTAEQDAEFDAKMEAALKQSHWKP